MAISMRRPTTSAEEKMEDIRAVDLEALGSGTPIPCLIKDDFEVDAVIPVPLLLQIAPSPKASEDPRAASFDSRLREVAALRKDVQRAFTGAKAKNVRSYADYIDGGLKGTHPLGVPAIHLWHPQRLFYVAYPPGQKSIVWPFGEIGVAIDGETQLEAWNTVMGSLRNPAASSKKVSVTIHHGKSLAVVRELFYLFNVMEVKPTASIAINMDPRDLATQIARELITSSDALRDHVNMSGRTAKSGEVTTLAAVRTAVLTTLRGRAGLQVGTRRLEMSQLEIASADGIRHAVLDTWRVLLDRFGERLTTAKTSGYVIAAPAILSGIGALAHHCMPEPPRDHNYEAWSADTMIALLNDVNWRARDEVDGEVYYPWDGVGGRVNSTGTFSVSGPKEVGHQVAFALENPTSEAGLRIRRGGD